MKTLFEIRSSSIKSVKALLGVLNKVFNEFGFMIKTMQEGDNKNRHYIYKFIIFFLISKKIFNYHNH